MRSRRRLRQLLIGTLRGTVVALSLLGYLAASIGFPAPAHSAKRTAQREPSSACSGGACGCGAEAGHCCCCSGKTKPTPPPPPPAPTPATSPSHCCNKGGDSEAPCPLCEVRVLLFVDPEEALELLVDEPCPFCAKAEDPAPCCGEQKPATSAKPEINTPPPMDEPSGDVSVRWVQGVQARYCHGLDTLWYGLTAALPLPPPLRWEADQRAADWLAPISPLADSVSRAPPAPPPRG
jgi:hypothetical protein